MKNVLISIFVVIGIYGAVVLSAIVSHSFKNENLGAEATSTNHEVSYIPEATSSTPVKIGVAELPPKATSGGPSVSNVSQTSPPHTPLVTVPATSTPTILTGDELCNSLPRSEIKNTTGLADGPLISFNFDDGFLSAYVYGVPLINAAGFNTSQFIITDEIGKPGRVTLAQIKDMEAKGNEIGAHTRTHPYLTRDTLEQVKDEICGSRKDLLDQGIFTTTFVYPEGDYNQQVENVVREAGFPGSRSTKAGLNNYTTDPYALRSYQVTASTTMPEIAYMIDQAIANKEWLILVFHRIDEEGNSISVSHVLVRQIVDYVKSKKIPVVTLSQGFGILSSITNNVNNLYLYNPSSSTPMQ